MEIVDVIVTGVTQYSFEDQSTGKMIEGCNVHFLNLETEENNNLVGFVPMKSTIPYDAFKKFSQLEYPQYCKASIKLLLSGKRPTVKFTNFETLGHINLFDFIQQPN